MSNAQNVTDKHGNTKGIQKRSWIPTKAELNKITEMILEGRSMRQVIANCGVRQETFYNKMKSTDPKMLTSEGHNKLQVAVETARMALGDRIENTILAKALNDKHPEHFKAATWYLEKVIYRNQDKEPQVVVIQNPNYQMDPKDIAEALRQARRKDIPIIDKSTS